MALWDTAGKSKKDSRVNAVILYHVAIFYRSAGQEDYDRVRPLSYAHTHVLLLCFAIDSPDSLDNVQEKVKDRDVHGKKDKRTNAFEQWIEELNTHCYGVPIILVGCKKDLRKDPKTVDELEKISQKPVSLKEVSITCVN